jgi:cytochrome c-type biogenesis protein CcmH/NrfG
MKILSIILLLFTTVPPAFQSPSGYLEIMQENIQALFAAETTAHYQSVVNTFTRIAQAEKEEWHPLYYATFGYIMMTTRAESTTDKDNYLDQAQEMLKKATERKPDESELVALEGFIHMMRITVDPATRGQQYSAMAMQAFHKAVQLNPENPRALYLLAQMEMGTARFFGTDTTAACDKLDQAIALFESFEPAHPLDPVWGLESAKAARQACSGE